MAAARSFEAHVWSENRGLCFLAAAAEAAELGFGHYSELRDFLGAASPYKTMAVDNIAGRPNPVDPMATGGPVAVGLMPRIYVVGSTF